MLLLCPPFPDYFIAKNATMKWESIVISCIANLSFLNWIPNGNWKCPIKTVCLSLLPSVCFAALPPVWGFLGIGSLVISKFCHGVTN